MFFVEDSGSESSIKSWIYCTCTVRGAEGLWEWLDPGGGLAALMKKTITECSIQLLRAVDTDFETDGTASGLVSRPCGVFVTLSNLFFFRLSNVLLPFVLLVLWLLSFWEPMVRKETL